MENRREFLGRGFVSMCGLSVPGLLLPPEREPTWRVTEIDHDNRTVTLNLLEEAAMGLGFPAYEAEKKRWRTLSSLA